MLSEDHPDAAGLLHRQALVDAGVDAAVADHDLAGDLGRIEHGGAVVVAAVAERDRGRVWRRQTRRPSESMSGAGPTAVATEAPVYVAPLPSVTEPSPLRLCVPAATVVIHGPGARPCRRRAAVAGRGRDEDARVSGEQERDLDRVEEVRRACR